MHARNTEQRYILPPPDAKEHIFQLTLRNSIYLFLFIWPIYKRNLTSCICRPLAPNNKKRCQTISLIISFTYLLLKSLTFVVQVDQSKVNDQWRSSSCCSRERWTKLTVESILIVKDLKWWFIPRRKDSWFVSTIIDLQNFNRKSTSIYFVLEKLTRIHTSIFLPEISSY
jgi:hypothetical protein